MFGKCTLDEYFGALMLRNSARVSGLNASNKLLDNVTFVPSLFGDGMLMYCVNMETSSCRVRYIDSKYCKRSCTSPKRWNITADGTDKSKLNKNKERKQILYRKWVRVRLILSNKRIRWNLRLFIYECHPDDIFPAFD